MHLASPPAIPSGDAKAKRRCNVRSHKLKRRGKTLNILGSSRTPHLESIAAIKQGMGDGQQAISVPAVSASPSSDNEISGAGSATTPEITVRVAPPKGAVGSAQILWEQPVTKSENGMPFHPLANIFPMVGEAELRDLA